MALSRKRFVARCSLLISLPLTAGLLAVPVSLADEEDDKPLGRRLDEAGARIKEAAANGEMTGEEAWAEWYDTRDRLIKEAVDAGEISSEEAGSLRSDIHKGELGQKLGSAGARIKQAVADGEMTEEQAHDEWQNAKNRLIDEALAGKEISEEDASHFHREIRKAELGERLGGEGARIKASVESGELSAEQARAAWQATKEQLIEDAIEAGDLTADEAEDWRRGIERAEAGQRLKEAVARGEMTEEQAWAQWAEINDQADQEEAARRKAKERAGDRTPNDPWARYVKRFIKRYDLKANQRRQAWDIYGDARKKAEMRAKQLESAQTTSDNPREQAAFKRAKEEVQREADRQFKQLKALLERLPTPAQRRAAKAAQGK